MSRDADRPKSSNDGDRKQVHDASAEDARPQSRWRAAIWRRAGYFTVGIAAFYVTAELRAHAGLLGVRGPDAYWALHWTRDYSSGFKRRGLLGEVLRGFGVDTADYLVITVLA